ncbi:MAG: RraA family protein [Cyclobacteriaceae bacterium]|nr:RraA family protein [Cyclobacteriaceae bacterium]
MKRLVLLLFLAPVLTVAQQKKELTDADILKLYEGLRVADVSDGMDMVGLIDVGLMDPAISPLWKDIDKFSHQLTGIAFTVRYVPTNRRTIPADTTMEGYKNWRDQWYTHISGEPFIKELRPGHVIIIENPKDGDTGSVGSNNSMLWKKSGALGIISSGGIRDTDEIIKQGIPVYTDYFQRGRGIRPGRNEFLYSQKPVVVGGVLIYPGDVIVADGDGVIVVPRQQALKVAIAAKEELRLDKQARLKLYKELGLPVDFTVEEKE